MIAELHLEKFVNAQAVSLAQAAFLDPALLGVSEIFFYLKRTGKSAV